MVGSGGSMRGGGWHAPVLRDDAPPCQLGQCMHPALLLGGIRRAEVEALLGERGLHPKAAVMDCWRHGIIGGTPLLSALPHGEQLRQPKAHCDRQIQRFVI